MSELGIKGESLFAAQMAIVGEQVPFLTGHELSWTQLFGGLAHVTYAVATDKGQRYVVKFLTQEMDDFGLMIPIGELISNTMAAGESGVGAKVLYSMPDVPSVVLEYIDGKTLSTEELSQPAYIPRIGEAVRKLHTLTPPMANQINIFKFLSDYLGLVERYTLDTPDGLLDQLPTVRRIESALLVHALPAVPSNNDLLAKNIMDNGSIRLIDYDFSGMNDPMFDVGDLAMEGDYDPDQVARVCEAYWNRHDPVQYARARLFGICAQYTWSLLFIGMDRLLSDSPDPSFNYWDEAVKRWNWTRRKLEDADIGTVIDTASL
jgi:thiamine kinase-like enzyme